MVVNPKASVLGMPAYGWVFLCSLFWIVVLTLDAPENLEPPDVMVLFEKEPILVKSSGNSVEYVPTAKEKKGEVLWEIVPTFYEDTAKVERLYGWHGKHLYFGLYKLHSKWTYSLQKVRFGRHPDDHKAEDLEIPRADLAKVRAIVAKVLNDRFPGVMAGDRFDKVLDVGIEETSYLCIQNVALALAYLGTVPAIIALAAMVTKAGQEASPVNDQSPSASEGQR